MLENNENNAIPSSENIDINTPQGNISGFDEATYTDTADGGFYSHTKESIIQDDIDTTYKNPYTPQGSVYSYTPSDTYTQSQTAQYTPVEKPKKEKKRYGVGVVIVAAVLAAVIGTVGSFGAMYLMKDYTSSDGGNDYVYEGELPSISDDNTDTDDVTSNVTDLPDSNQPESTLSVIGSAAQTVAAKTSGSVVGIRTTTSVSSFFGGSSESTGEGSGVLYTEQGHIITNYHVISDAISSSRSKIEVFFDNCNTEPYTATVVGYNISTDLAVIKITPNGRKPLELGNSDKLAIGQFAITMGAPGGLEFMGSVTYGIISGLDRVVSSDSTIGLIQTDAAINPGNSGGALLDSEGRLIGINSSKIASVEFEGMGFAIPINTVVEVCNNIIQKKGNGEAYIGITISEKYTADVLKSYGYPSGAVVSSVADGSPAASAGIRRGDIITEFAGVKITEFDVYYETLAKCKSGQTVEVKVYRGGKNYKTNITVISNTAS